MSEEKRMVLKVANVATLIVFGLSFMLLVLLTINWNFYAIVQRGLGWNAEVMLRGLASIGIFMAFVNWRISTYKVTKFMLFWAAIVATGCSLFMACVLDNISPFRTMPLEIDSELFVDEYGHLAGKELGVYAFDVTPDDAVVKLYWQCNSITSYGPIRKTDMLEPRCYQNDEGNGIAIDFTKYADGVWVTIKEFSVEDDAVPVFFGEDEREILAECLDSVPHEIVNLSGKTIEEINAVINDATWGAISFGHIER